MAIVFTTQGCTSLVGSIYAQCPPAAVATVAGGFTAAACARALQGGDVDGHQDTDDDELDGLGAAPSDAEATIMLLRNKLYPDPASAAAAASAAKQSRHAKRSKAATGPSKAAAAAITAAAAAAAAAKQLPPIVLKSQLYTVLTDRTAADKDLEALRRDGRVHVFKLAIGKQDLELACSLGGRAANRVSVWLVAATRTL
jgi:hypothetical protein